MWIENDTEDWDEPVIFYILIFCVLCHVGMNAAIAWRERKVQIQLIHVNQLQSTSATVLVDGPAALTLTLLAAIIISTRAAAFK